RPLDVTLPGADQGVWALPLAGGARLDGRQLHGDPASPPGAGTLRMDAPAVRVDDVPHDGEPEAEPAVHAARSHIALPEPLEHVRKERRVDALAGVTHGDLDVRVDALEDDLDAPAPGREPDRVRQQVPHP